MTAYVVVTLQVHDRGWMKDYAANVPDIVRAYGGDYLAIGTRVIQPEGVGVVPDQIAILTYPTLAALEACISSPEYAPYRASRTGPADTRILAFEAI